MPNQYQPRQSTVRFLMIAMFGLTLTGCNQIRQDTEASPDVAQPSIAETRVMLPTKAKLEASIIATTDLWSRIRANLKLDFDDNPRIDVQLKGLLKNPHHVARVSKRSEPFLHLIVEEVQKRDLPMELALLPAIESGFRPFAYSSGRAAGLWQFMPATGLAFGLKQTRWYDGRRDVPAATSAALDYLQQLNRRFDGDWLLALASYNAGAGTVSRAMRRNKKAGKATDYWHLDLPRETMNYVPRLLAMSRLVANPAQYKVSLHPIADEAKLVVIDIGGQMDLSRAALLAEMKLEELHSLNPGFNRWATDPEGPHRLLIPHAQADLFQGNLQKMPANARVEWHRHLVEKGDSLGVLAQRYHTTVTTLRQLNALFGNNIRIGQALMVPVASSTKDMATLTMAQALIERQNPTLVSKKTIYTVKSGDTLWSISRRYKVSTGKLAGWNPLSSKGVLKIGQTLLIGGSKVSSGALLKVGRKALNPVVRYTVRKGDSLYKIAQRYKVSIKSLRVWNKGTLGKYLKPGQNITIRVGLRGLTDA